MSNTQQPSRSSLGRSLAAAALMAAGVLATSAISYAQLNSGEPQILSTNQTVTPLAPRAASYNALNPGLADLPDYTVGQAVTTVVSPDRKTLLILTTGFNQEYYLTGANAGSPIPDDSTEWIFVYDIAGSVPTLKQTIPIPNSYSGITFNPNSKQFYAAGGVNDNVHIYDLAAGKWSESAASPVKLGHIAGNGLSVPPEAAGIAVNSNGKVLVVANYENDSVSILKFENGSWQKTGELDLRPGVINAADSGVPGGEFPFWVVIKGDNAYVTSVRDREIDVISFAGTPTFKKRIKVKGSPNKAILDKAQDLLFVAEDNSDSVAVIDTNTNTLVHEIKVTAPRSLYKNSEGYKGATPNSVTLSPDEQTLYVTNAGENAVAVVRNPLTPKHAYVEGLIPTGFYPNSISTSRDGSQLFIVNGKSATGPNPQQSVSNAYGTTSNQYDLQLTKAGFQSLPVPTKSELRELTKQVLQNDNFFVTVSPEQAAKVEELHDKIKHVIYVIKENRTYDQVLGDLPVGDGDPTITQFGEAITPNFHKIATNFVDFDNFYDVSDVSGDGWPWSTSARTTDTIEKEIPANYAGRGLSNNSEGSNRNLNVGLATAAQRTAADPFLAAFGLNNPNILPGTANVGAPDSADGDENGGYIFNAVLKAGLSVRNYGQFIDIIPYLLPSSSGGIDPIVDPYTAGKVVAVSTQPALAPYTDPYFRGFDNVFPDYYRFKEWDREFSGFEKKGNLPSLSLVRFMHDHTGNFGTAIAGVNTIELQEADNDYAVGLLAESLAHSKQYKDNTLICVIEDDAQDGGDHVDAHRSTFYLIGPYVKHGYVDSTRYNSVSVLRTIEDILGTKHLNLNDAHAVPMLDAFDLKAKDWNYKAKPSQYLASTTLPIPPSEFDADAKLNFKSMHDSKWWAERTKGMDFSKEDHLDTKKYNRLVWAGTMGNKPYPTLRSHKNLRENRQQLLHPTDTTQAPAAAGNKPTVAGSAE